MCPSLVPNVQSPLHHSFQLSLAHAHLLILILSALPLLGNLLDFDLKNLTGSLEALSKIHGKYSIAQGHLP